MNVGYVDSYWEQFLKNSVSELLLALHLRRKQPPSVVLQRSLRDVLHIFTQC